MNPEDPFALFGLDRTATLQDLRSARRRLALDRHPDRGGSDEQMKVLNAAFDAAVGHITGRRPLTPSPGPRANPSANPRSNPPTAPRSRPLRTGARVQRDAPSFMVYADRQQTFEGLRIVTSWIGEILVEDPPTSLEVHLFEPAPCWCHLALQVEGSACAVSLTVAASGAAPAPQLRDVRDLWVEQLNRPGAMA